MSAIISRGPGWVATAPTIPGLVRQKIAEFLAAGHTGQITLDVKEGRILAYKLTEAGRVPALDHDEAHGCAPPGAI